VVDKAALGQVFSEYLGSPANLHSTKFSILTITCCRYNRPEAADVPNGQSMDSPRYANLKFYSSCTVNGCRQTCHHVGYSLSEFTVEGYILVFAGAVYAVIFQCCCQC
jgi:hypothetical protein